MSIFREGDYVTVLRKPPPDYVWGDEWVHDMDEAVGRTLKVNVVHPDNPLKVGLSDRYNYPCKYLQLADRGIPTDTGAQESTPGRKETNPKDAVGTKKPPVSTVSGPVLMELGAAMLEGARKYGRHNYRVTGVRASVYYDAAFRHMVSWFEGEDTDPDSGMSHITKAIASLVVLRDAQINNKLVDDRPPSSGTGWLRNVQEHVDDIFKRYPTSKEARIKGD